MATAVHDQQSRQLLWQQQTEERQRLAREKWEARLKERRDKAAAENKQLSATISGLAKKKYSILTREVEPKRRRRTTCCMSI